MALRSKKNSAFVAFQAHELDFDSDGSDNERAQREQKEKQKQKKKAKSKKKNNDNSLLKELAMCSTSTKKSKAKAKSSNAAQPEPAEEAKANNNTPTAQQAAATSTSSSAKAKPLSSNAPTKPPAPSPSPSPSAPSTATAPVAPVAPKAQTAAAESKATSWAKSSGPVGSAPAKSGSKSPRKQANGTSSPTQPQQSNNSDLGAIYSPTHITVTRADGQVSRQISVAEMMDQLVRFQQLNAQLTVQNRTLQEQVQFNAGLVTSLQNEVTMFRQLCLNLQGQLTQLQSGAPGGNLPPMMNGHSNGPSGFAPRAHQSRVVPPPPPGMT
ncbi:hypothetical protein PINS_up010534 [Pythium insidiosum]|nr:hypothetical protein PINS_up010534 [Pythium insidiosum]